MAPNALAEVLAPRPPAFALLHRPESGGPDALDVLVGEVSAPRVLSGVPLPARREPTAGSRHDVLAIIPYRQIAERGFDCADDGAPLLALNVTGEARVPLDEALARLPRERIRLHGGHFTPDDARYADTVRQVVADEIGRGEGANFVIKRSFLTEIVDYTPRSALVFFRRLLERERGAYWTFLVHTPGRTFVGASPERHVSLRDGTAVMNPISGTYRYPPSGPELTDVMSFLADRKEADELYMVVDEELKMMARVCEPGIRAVGPFLKEMARLAHTEYFIEGRSAGDPREILRETMLAPTVTGSPLESACRVIRRYEPKGRGYYSGVAALIGRDRHGERTMDSAILIRTAEIEPSGLVRIGAGATLVRHSAPDSEVAETRAKAAGLLAALRDDPRSDAGTRQNHSRRPRLGEHPRVRAALEQRNETIAGFWFRGGAVQAPRTLAGRRALVVDAEDTFTSMLGHQLRSLGLSATVRRFDESYTFDQHELVVMGPGPGDPLDLAHPKIAHLHSAVRTLLERRQPFLAVCLSHQVLASVLNLPLLRRESPNQGEQREIDLFGSRELVGFYNSFVARSDADGIEDPRYGLIEVSRDPRTGEVHALRGPNFASLQFHAESLLTQSGVRIIGSLLGEMFERRSATPGPEPASVPATEPGPEPGAATADQAAAV